MIETNTQYPHLLSISPYGKDLFEGKPQERIRDAIEKYITDTDTASDDSVGMPPQHRIIGLEGKWGSGKSNVIEMLRKVLQKEYRLFTYDAWGNQEDLQRRTILELLTQDLIDSDVIKSDSFLPSYKNKKKVDAEEQKFRPRTWNDRIKSIRTQKSYTNELTIPSIYNATKLFVIAILATGLLIPFLELLKPDSMSCGYRVLFFFVALAPLILFFLYMMIEGKSWTKMVGAYSTSGNSETHSYQIIEGEPTIREFQEWMKDISSTLKGEKLIIVFDNMDRLSTSKVRQLWSLIYTFFADNSYGNIWCIVPYDENHLAKIFCKEGEEGANEQLRHFLNKTFPIIYRVPEPIITDYKAIVSKLLRDVFGDTLEDETLDKVNNLYRTANPIPNVRGIITFINKMVLLKQQWGDELRIVSIAIFILKEEELKTNTEEYIISKEYEEIFRSELMGEDREGIMNDIAALFYGVAPKDAYQIALKQGIEKCLNNLIGDTSIETYVEEPHFTSILEEVVKGLTTEGLYKVAQVISKINKNKLSKNDAKRISSIWSHMGQTYIELGVISQKPFVYENVLFANVKVSLQEKCIRVFYTGLFTTDKISGGDAFEALENLFSEPYAKKWNPQKMLPRKGLNAAAFLDYVQRAGKKYKTYPVQTAKGKLNEYIISILDKDFPYIESIRVLHEVREYDLSSVGTSAVSKLNKPEAGARELNNLIRIQRIFYPEFQNPGLSPMYIEGMWKDISRQIGESYYPEIFTLAAMTVAPSTLPHDEHHMEILKERAHFYKSTSALLEHVLVHKSSMCLKNFFGVCIKEKIHHGAPDFNDFVSRWETITNLTKVTYKDLVEFADSWGIDTISESEESKSIQALLRNADWVSEIKGRKTALSNKLIQKAVKELTSKEVGSFINSPHPSATTYWKRLLRELITTDYINNRNFGKLADIVAYLLDGIARGNVSIKYEEWEAVINKCPLKSISHSIDEIRDKFLKGQYSMTPTKFLVLHEWLEKAGINEEQYLVDAANKILDKVINDKGCQDIIINKINIYKPILAVRKEEAPYLYDKLVRYAKGNTEFGKFVSDINKNDSTS